jgi:hypothetical protein
LRVYTIHHDPVSVGLESDFVVVKEGFSWPAFVFTALWALWHGMWLAFIVLVVAGIALDFAVQLVAADNVSSLAIGLGYALFVGFGANDWRRWTLARRGKALMGVVAAPDGETALHRYVDRNPDLQSRRRAVPGPVLGLP